MPTKKTPTPPRRIEYMPLEDLPEADRNPKGHDTARIAGSISRFGFADAPILDERTGQLVAGHGRRGDLLARKEAGQDPPDGVQVDAEGRWLVPVQRGWASRSSEDAEAFLVAHNRLTETGGWVDHELAEMLDDLRDVDPDLLALTGYTDDDIDAMAAFHAPHDFDGGDLQDALDDADRAAWPWVKVQLDPQVYARFTSLPGDTDEERLIGLLNRDGE